MVDVIMMYTSNGNVSASFSPTVPLPVIARLVTSWLRFVTCWKPMLRPGLRIRKNVLLRVVELPSGLRVLWTSENL